MPDREKVIKGLECCKEGANYADPICSKCPYKDVGDCVPLLVADALALLKAQEPRLMRLEASEADWRDGVLWFEQRDYTPMRPCLFRECREQKLFGRLERVMCLDLVGHSGSIYMLKNYGKKWRCWTSRPTDEVRRATPWQTPSINASASNG